MIASSNFGKILRRVLLAWVALAIIMYVVYANTKDSGKLGDTFGLVNSLVSAITFAGVFYTISLQKEEMHEAKRQIEKQQNLAFKQQYETTFFNLLTLHTNLVNNLKYKNVVSRDVFTELSNTFPEELQQLYHPIVPIPIKDKNRLSELSSEYFYNVNPEIQRIIQHYLSSLIAIYEYLTSETEVDEKYLKIFNAYISEPEKAVIFIHATCCRQDKKSKILKAMISRLKIFTDVQLFDEMHEEND